MKKILLCVILLVITTSTNVYAFIHMFDLMGRIGVEVSVGVTAFGIGTGFLRGSDAKTMINGFERDLSSSISFAPMAQFDILIEYIPGFAAIETSVGYSYSSLTYEKGEGQNKVKNTFIREEITVPNIGLRLGYDLNVISPLQNSENVSGNDFFHDNLSVSFTYRYLINHRWHGFQTV